MPTETKWFYIEYLIHDESGNLVSFGRLDYSKPENRRDFGALAKGALSRFQTVTTRRCREASR